MTAIARNIKHRWGSTKSKVTSKQTKQLEKRVQHGEVDKIYRTINLSTRKRPQGEGPPISIQYDYYGAQTTTSGRQAANSLFYLNLPGMYQTSSGVGYTARQSPTGYFSLLPYRTTTATAGPAAAVVAFPLNLRLGYHSTTVKFVLSNWGNTHVECLLYILVAKKTHTLGTAQPEDYWSNGYADSGLGMAASVQRKLATSAVAGYPTRNVLYTKPNDSQVFKNYWKIAHLEEVRLTSGQTTMNMTFNIKMNKLIEYDKISAIVTAQGGTASNVVMPGSLSFMLVTRGASVGKTATDATAAIVPTEIGWVAQIKHWFQNAPKGSTELKIMEAVQTEYADATNTTTMNEIDASNNDVKL